MPTEIRFSEGSAVTVAEEYRSVYEKLLAADWQLPCEFTQAHDASQPITINPVYVLSFHAVSEAATTR